MEESKINKLIFEFDEIESTRKRPSSLAADDDIAECSKRLRTKMEQIDLSSNSSTTMELSDYEDEDVVQESVSSTSAENDPKVKIISVDIIKEADTEISNDARINENASEPINVDEIQDQPSNNANDESRQEKNRRPSESNRIVISDSSDDEEDTNNFNNRRYSDGGYAYSFADVNGNRFESRASFDDDLRRHRRRRETFNENARRTYRNCTENMERIFNHAESAREQAMRNFRTSANLIPNLLSTFQSHFRPLFQQQQQSGFNQQYNRYRRY